jgi:hypothetical protein
MKKINPILLSLLILIIMSSCASINQTLKLDKIKSDYPISATKSIYTKGQVIRNENMDNSKPFTLSKEIKVPLKEKSAYINLSSDLISEINKSGANGITDLKINIIKIDDSANSWVAFERGLGSFLGAIGIGLMYVSSTIPKENGGENYLPAIITVGTGSGIFGMSFIHEKLGTVKYSLQISGFTIKY